MREHAERLDDWRTRDGQAGFGITYPTPGGKPNDRTRVELHGYRTPDGTANFELHLANYYASGVLRELYGSMSLTQEDATRLALAIAPHLAGNVFIAPTPEKHRVTLFGKDTGVVVELDRTYTVTAGPGEVATFAAKVEPGQTLKLNIGIAGEGTSAAFGTGGGGGSGFGYVNGKHDELAGGGSGGKHE